MAIPYRNSEAPHVLFVGHEASRTGAPIGFLRLIAWLVEAGGIPASVWLRRSGPLLEEHREIANLAVGADAIALERLSKTFHLAYVNTATLGMQAEALKSAGLPVICHVHEMDFELGLTSEANRERLRRSVDRFVACSEATRDAIVRSLGVPVEMITVVPECVDIDRVLRAVKQPVPFAVKSPEQKLVAGMGVVSWRKGVDLFVRLCAELAGMDPAWHGLWIGDLETGPDAARVRHEIRILGMEGRIRFTGSLPDPHALLAQADVFCLTSREDPYPLAMVEAAVLGKPVVGFAGGGGVEEFCRVAGGKIVGYADISAMAAAVQALENGESEPGRGLAAARALCHPDVVGSPIERLIKHTALSDGVSWTSQKAAAVAASGGDHVTAAVVVNIGGLEKRLDWEVVVSGEAAVEFAFTEPVSGPLKVTLQVGTQNLVLRDVEIGWASVTGMTAAVIPEVDTAGRAVSLGKSPASSWLLLDGKGRLVLHVGNVPPIAALSVRWHSSPDVKGAVRALVKSEPTSIWQGIFELLPAGRRESTMGPAFRGSKAAGEEALWS